jgi:hypothetical protein
MPNGLMDEQAVKQWILRKLGAPLLRVELTEDDLTDAIEDARRWFSAKKGFKSTYPLTLVSSTVEYTLPDQIDTVLDVTFTNSALDVQRFVDPLSLLDGLVPANVLGAGIGGMGGWGAGGGMLSAYAQTVQYLREARKVLNADNEWIQKDRTLLILPQTTRGGVAMLDYKAAKFTIEQLNERDHDMVKRKALAIAREKLGTIFSKYDQFPSAQGAAVINGPAQLDKAEREHAGLEEEIAQSGFPMGFLVG